MEEKDLKKKIEEIEKEVDLPGQKKRYKGYKRGFTRKYTKFSK
jgi:hypothetical protein